MSQSPRHPRRQPLNSVSAKIITFVFASTFLTASIVSWISVDSTHSHLRQQIEAQFPAHLERVGDDLEAWSQMVGSSLATARAGKLADWLETSPFFQSVGRVRTDGRVREVEGTSAERLAEIASALGSIEAPTIRTVALSEDHSAMVVARRMGRDRLIGVVSPGAIAGQLAASSTGVAGSILLIDGGGRVVAALDTDEPLDRPTRTQLRELGEDHPDVVHDLVSESGSHLIASALPVDDLGATLVIQQPYGVAFRPVLDVITRVFVSDLFIILLSSLLAYRITRRLMHPIEALSESARRISQGHLDEEIPEDPHSNDEIGLLTRTFNEMIRELRRNHQDIERANSRLTNQYDELLSANEILAQLSITDGLTKLHNHRYFQEHLSREIKRVDRAREPLSMLLLDLDDFKQFNDRMGHSAGDELLVKIADILSESIRETDLLARYGGEEFVVLTPNTDLEGAVALAEKIRMTVADMPHILDDSLRPVRVTLSVGVAQFGGDRKQFFQSADRALYRAKAAGKNCVMAGDDKVI